MLGFDWKSSAFLALGASCSFGKGYKWRALHLMVCKLREHLSWRMCAWQPERQKDQIASNSRCLHIIGGWLPPEPCACVMATLQEWSGCNIPYSSRGGISKHLVQAHGRLRAWGISSTGCPTGTIIEAQRSSPVGFGSTKPTNCLLLHHIMGKPTLSSNRTLKQGLSRGPEPPLSTAFGTNQKSFWRSSGGKTPHWPRLLSASNYKGRHRTSSWNLPDKAGQRALVYCFSCEEIAHRP